MDELIAYEVTYVSNLGLFCGFETAKRKKKGGGFPVTVDKAEWGGRRASAPTVHLPSYSYPQHNVNIFNGVPTSY